MSWLPASTTAVSHFVVSHGILVTVIVCVTPGLIVGLPKLFENLPAITESIYKRRRGNLEAKKDIKAARAEGKANRIRAITDRRASHVRLKEQSRLLRRAKVVSPDDAVRLIQAIHTDPDQPEKRRLPDEVLGEIYSEGNRNGATTRPRSGPPGDVRRLPKPGPP